MAVERFGTQRLGDLLKPAERLAREGVIVDQSFYDLTKENEERFRMFPETARVFLRDGKTPAVGTRWNNPDIARAYRELRTHGVESLYGGRLGRAVVAEARDPHTAPGVEVPAGQLTLRDLERYRAIQRKPVHSEYRGYDVYGMPVPSSGGIAVAEILNLLEAYDQRTGQAPVGGQQRGVPPPVQRGLRNGVRRPQPPCRRRARRADPELVSQDFADERACLFDPERPRRGRSRSAARTATTRRAARRPAGRRARRWEVHHHLSVADRWGNVVAYTLTIEQYGGSGITVPGYGFLLNNELTDFNFAPLQPGVPDPNLPGAGQAAALLDEPDHHRRGWPAHAHRRQPGRRDDHHHRRPGHHRAPRPGSRLVDAIAAPRLSSRNGAEDIEPALRDSDDGAALAALGHVFTTQDVIGNAAAIRLWGRGDFEAAAETTRRGGGSAMVVRPEWSRR